MGTNGLSFGTVTANKGDGTIKLLKQMGYSSEEAHSTELQEQFWEDNNLSGNNIFLGKEYLVTGEAMKTQVEEAIFGCLDSKQDNDKLSSEYLAEKIQNGDFDQEELEAFSNQIDYLTNTYFDNGNIDETDSRNDEWEILNNYSTMVNNAIELANTPDEPEEVEEPFDYTTLEGADKTTLESYLTNGEITPEAKEGALTNLALDLEALPKSGSAIADYTAALESFKEKGDIRSLNSLMDAYETINQLTPTFESIDQQIESSGLKDCDIASVTGAKEDYMKFMDLGYSSEDALKIVQTNLTNAAAINDKLTELENAQTNYDILEQSGLGVTNRQKEQIQEAIDQLTNGLNTYMWTEDNIKNFQWMTADQLKEKSTDFTQKCLTRSELNKVNGFIGDINNDIAVATKAPDYAGIKVDNNEALQKAVDEIMNYEYFDFDFSASYVSLIQDGHTPQEAEKIVNYNKEVIIQAAQAKLDMENVNPTPSQAVILQGTQASYDFNSFNELDYVNNHIIHNNGQTNYGTTWETALENGASLTSPAAEMQTAINNISAPIGLQKEFDVAMKLYDLAVNNEIPTNKKGDLKDIRTALGSLNDTKPDFSALNKTTLASVAQSLKNQGIEIPQELQDALNNL